ncbi:peptide-methionine (S)-S-oxide reductase MsrA [Candidatus Daviesbacteria bacterium]|nr:peptide-methionine (S)-S-oxide reductase MsrA [Candidatus Daviesbacteria bacterium]
METATLAGGCFWCTEAIFKRLKGVISVTSGYSGGKMENPSYDQVVHGNTNHAEAIQIKFDPHIISFETLLEVFFALHDPTTLNRQGADIGTQYRSVIFYYDDKQKKIAEEVKTKVEKSKMYSDTIVTEITPFSNFFKAEDYHQNFYENQNNSPYCSIVIDPKIQKLLEKFNSLVKEEYK